MANLVGLSHNTVPNIGTGEGVWPNNVADEPRACCGRATGSAGAGAGTAPPPASGPGASERGPKDLVSARPLGGVALLAPEIQMGARAHTRPASRGVRECSASASARPPTATARRQAGRRRRACQQLRAPLRAGARAPAPPASSPDPETGGAARPGARARACSGPAAGDGELAGARGQAHGSPPVTSVGVAPWPGRALASAQSEWPPKGGAGGGAPGAPVCADLNSGAGAARPAREGCARAELGAPSWAPVAKFKDARAPPPPAASPTAGPIGK